MSAPLAISPVGYSAALVSGCLGRFVIVRALQGSLSQAFPAECRRPLRDAVQKLFNSPLPVVYLARESNGFRFEAPREISSDVGLVLEDLSSRKLTWHDLQPGTLPPAWRAA